MLLMQGSQAISMLEYKMKLYGVLQKSCVFFVLSGLADMVYCCQCHHKHYELL